MTACVQVFLARVYSTDLCSLNHLSLSNIQRKPPRRLSGKYRVRRIRAQDSFITAERASAVAIKDSIKASVIGEEQLKTPGVANRTIIVGKEVLPSPCFIVLSGLPYLLATSFRKPLYIELSPVAPKGLGLHGVSTESRTESRNKGKARYSSYFIEYPRIRGLSVPHTIGKPKRERKS